jgi:hypothetical protein
VVALEALSALAPFVDPPLEPESPENICSRFASGSALVAPEVEPD